MTRQQIIQNIKARISTIESYRPEEYALNEGNLFELKDLLSMIEKDEPSLPSNIDEAAEEYADYNSQRWHEDGDVYYDHSKIVDAFKAGAEWMEGQGSSFKVNVEEVPQGHWYAGLHLGKCAEEEENALKSINAKDGEEVIVQIRKKEE